MTDEKRRKPRSEKTRPKKPRSKPLGDVVKDLWQDVIDALDSFVNPQPVPIPVPIRNPRRR